MLSRARLTATAREVAGVRRRVDWIANWDEFADGARYSLIIGEDTPALTVEEFRNRAYSAATRKGLTAHTHVVTDEDEDLRPAVRSALKRGKTVIELVMRPA